ncbi:MAG: tripartite tricarboxylate transporter TctB family protein [Gammaproteobacteria bacterium]
MQRAETACALVLLLLAAVVAREGIRLDIGWGDIGPKAGFFPFWLAVLLGLSSLTVLAKSLWTWGKHDEKPFLSGERLPLLLTVLVPIALVVPAIAVVGFYVTAFLYLSLYIWWTGKKHWSVTLSMSVLFPFAIYLIFEKWFLIPLPKGILEPYLPF